MATTMLRNFGMLTALIVAVMSCSTVPEYEKQAPFRLIGQSDHSVTALAWALDGRTVYSADSRGVIRGWDVQSALPVATLATWANNVAFSVGGTRAFVGYRSQVRVVNMKGGQVESEQLVRVQRSGFSVRNAYLSPEGTRAVIIDQVGNVSALDLGSYRYLPGFSHTVSIGYAIDGSSFSPTGDKVLLASSKMPLARIVDADSGRILHKIVAAEGGIRASGFTIDGRQIATVGMKNRLRLWDATTGEHTRNFDTARAPGINRLAFSPYRDLAVTGHNGGFVTIWDSATGLVLRQFAAHDGWVEAMALSPDGKKLVTGSPDKTVKLWDLPSLLAE